MPASSRPKSFVVNVGGVKIGGNHPSVVQSMTNTDTADTTATVNQIMELAWAGASAMANYLQQFCAGRRIWPICGIMRYKSMKEMTRLLPLARKIIVTSDHARSTAPQEIRGLYSQAEPIEIAPRVRGFLAVVEQAASHDLIIETGSLYLAGEARALHQARPLSVEVQSTR